MNIKGIVAKSLFLLLGLCMTSQVFAQADCATAVDIGTVGNETHCLTAGTYDINADMSAASASTVAVATCDAVAGGNVDLWYQFTTGSGSGDIQVIINSGANQEANLVIYSGSCGALVEQGCSAFPNTAFGQYFNLVPSTTYYLQVLNDDSDSPKGINNICLQESACTTDNDDCSTPTEINITEVFSGSTGCYTNDGPAFVNTATCAPYLVGSNSWYTFEASATSAVFDYSTPVCVSSTGTGIDIAIYDLTVVTCGSISSTTVPVFCQQLSNTGTPTNVNITGLVAGRDYLIMVNGVNDLDCFYTLEPVSGIVVIPPNDECANATSLTCGGNVTGDANNATSTDAPAACGGVTPAEGVWFTISGDGSDITVSTDNAGTAGTFDTELTVYSGSCGALTCIGGDDNGGTGNTSSFTFTSVNGTDYYVYLGGSNLGAYELSTTCITCNANAGNW